MIQFESDQGAVVVVGEDQVSDYTLSGYSLKAVVQETYSTLVTVMRGHLNPPAMPGALGVITNSYDQEYAPTTVTKYILGLPADESARRTLEGSQKLLEENKTLQEKVEATEKTVAALEIQIIEALKTCKEFAEEREDLAKKHEAEKLLLQARVNALNENAVATRADLKRLSELSDPLRRILSLEDWIIKAARVVPLAILTAIAQKLLDPVPVTSPKTWAERLVEDDD